MGRGSTAEAEAESGSCGADIATVICLIDKADFLPGTARCQAACLDVVVAKERKTKSETSFSRRGAAAAVAVEVAVAARPGQDRPQSKWLQVLFADFGNWFALEIT